MKKPIQLLAVLIALLFAMPQAFADGVMARLATGVTPSSVVSSYSEILGMEQAGSSPFVRFEVDGEDVDGFLTALSSDSRISWFDYDGSFSTFEQRSSHGSSVAAIWERSRKFPDNNAVWEQINYSPIDTIAPYTPIRVGIVDTGVSPYQSWITSSIVASKNTISDATGATIDDLPEDLDTNENLVFDEGAGHGTMVAGLILQLAPSNPLVVAKAADSDGNGTAWSVLKGIVFCVENNAKVINMSLGGISPIVGFSQVTDWADAQGCLIVSPVGNNDAEGSMYPAAYSKVVCVAGLTSSNTKASFSNYDSVVRVAAPATGIESSWWDGGTATFSGTSLASPIVVGCIAALPVSFTPSQMRTALVASGTNIDSLNSSYSGKIGRLLNFWALYSYFTNQ